MGVPLCPMVNWVILSNRQRVLWHHARQVLGSVSNRTIFFDPSLHNSRMLHQTDRSYSFFFIELAMIPW